MTDTHNTLFHRRYMFKLYPTVEQDAAMHEQRQMMADLWNALLQRNEDMYHRTRAQRGVMHADGKSRLTFFDMTNEITALRRECPEWAALSVWSAHRVAKSLELAFQAFFRRAKSGAGASSGYPRYRARMRATTIPHRCQSGCKLVPVARERSDDQAKPKSAREWRLTIKGVSGPIRARGEFPGSPLSFKDAEVIWRDGNWWFSVCVEIAQRRSPGSNDLTVRFNLIDEFARVERAEGRRTACEGSARVPAQIPNHLNALAGGPATDELAGSEVRVVHGLITKCDMCPAATYAGSEARSEIHQRLLRAAAHCATADEIKSDRDLHRRKHSWRWRRETTRAARHAALSARIRKDALHVWSTSIVRLASDLTVLTPRVREISQSPRGNIRDWGANVAAVSQLNRNTLNQCPAMAAQMLAYKAAEAGIRCDVVADESTPLVVGPELVKVGKLQRRAKRQLRKAS